MDYGKVNSRYTTDQPTNFTDEHIDVVDFTYNFPCFVRLLSDHSNEFQQFSPVYHPVYVFTETLSTDRSYQVVEAYNRQLIDPSVDPADSIKYSINFCNPDRFLFDQHGLEILDILEQRTKKANNSTSPSPSSSHLKGRNAEINEIRPNNI
nr:5748_t:CDS:2 [Entrophospora candida]